MAFAVYRTGQLWTGGRDPESTTPVLYLPTAGGNFVSAIVAAAFDLPDLAALLFGAGLLAWFALESVLMNRLYVHPPLAPPLRPTLGIQLAPAVVGCSAYLSLISGQPDLFAKGLLGYGLLQALIIARMLPWIMVQPFAVSYWAFTFGLTSMAFDAISSSNAEWTDWRRRSPTRLLQLQYQHRHRRYRDCLAIYSRPDPSSVPVDHHDLSRCPLRCHAGGAKGGGAFRSRACSARPLHRLEWLYPCRSA